MGTEYLKEMLVAIYIEELGKYVGSSYNDKILDDMPPFILREKVLSFLENSNARLLIDKADAICLGNDNGDRLEEKGEKLSSIVASAALFEKRGKIAWLPLSEKNPSSCIPGQVDAGDAGEFVSHMIYDGEKLRDKKNFDEFFIAFDSLFEHYFSSFPSISKGVSVYQRAKTKAAIASALALYVDENGVDDIDSGKPFALVSGDATGIQKYIFGINTHKFSAKLLRARSFQIWIESFLMAGHIVRAFGLTNANIITFSGGKFLLLLPKLKTLEETLEKVRISVDKLCIDSYAGNIAYVISKGVACSCSDLRAENVDELEGRIREDAFEAKERKLQSGIRARKEGPVLSEQYQALGISGNVCVSCEGSVAKDEDGFCDACSYLVSLGRDLNRENASIYLNFGIIGGLSETVRISKPGKIMDGFSEYSMSNYVEGKARLSMPYYVPRDEDDDVITFEGLSKLAEGNEGLAMFKADVDYLGLIFSSSLKESWSLSRYAALSAAFHFYFSEHLVTFIRENFKSLYVVFSGGDDVALLGPWNEIITFADKFNSDFRAFTGDNESITVSAGIALFKPNTPLPIVSENAEEALELSKGRPSKNGITLFSRTVGWDEFREQIELAGMLGKMPDINRSGFLYRLLSYSDSAAFLADEKVVLSPENMRKALWLSHFKYALGRSEIKDQNLLSTLQKLCVPREMVNARVAASIALYGSRGGDDE